MSMSDPLAPKKWRYTTTKRPSLSGAISGSDCSLFVIRLSVNCEPTGENLVATTHSPHFDARQGRYTVVYSEVPDGSLNDCKASKIFSNA